MKKLLVLGGLGLVVLAGCPRPRTFALRVFEEASAKTEGDAHYASVGLDAATARWRCPKPLLGDEDFKPARIFRTGAVVSEMNRDADLACTIEVSAPGFRTTSFPVASLCQAQYASKESCGGIDAAVFLRREGAAAEPRVIPLDAPRGNPPTLDGGGEISAILRVEVAADGTTSVDGKKIAGDDELRAVATRAASNPDLRAVIMADTAAQHGRVIHVLDILKQAKIGRIAFAVQPAP